MSNSFARAVLQVLALLTGLAVASVWRDRHNVLLHYPELRSTKAGLALGVNGAQSFLRTPVTLAAGALNLGAWFGHQEIVVDHIWKVAPAVTFRARARGASELAVEFRPEAGGDSVLLRLSNRLERPSAWLRMDPSGRFTARMAVSYVLPKARWLRISMRPGHAGLEASVSGTKLPPQPIPAGPLRVAFRGDSSAARLRIDDLRIRAGGDVWSQSFTGEMPWLLFLFATAVASIAFYAFERITSPRVAAVGGGAGFLVLCAALAVYRGVLVDLYPTRVNLAGAASRIETRAEALKRLKALPSEGRPVLLWLGGSQAWGAGASAPDRTAFALLRARLEKNSRLDWVNGAISASKVADQREALEAVAKRRKVAWVVLTAGVNDAENPRFAAELAAFADVVKAAGAKLFLVPEPVEPGRAELGARQAEVVAAARAAGVPYAEPQAELRAHGDDGYLWWDFVHLTDAGARVEADALEAPLARALARGN